jgi:hypothetical protein
MSEPSADGHRQSAGSCFLYGTLLEQVLAIGDKDINSLFED